MLNLRFERRVLPFCIAGFISIIGIWGVMALRSSINPWAKQMLMDQAAILFGGNLSVGTLKLTLLKGQFQVSHIVLKQPPGFSGKPLLRASRIRIDVDVRRLLFHKELNIQGITVFNPELNFCEKSDGETNALFYLSLLFPKRVTSENNSMKLVLKRFIIKNGRVRFENYRLTRTQPVLQMKKVRLELKDLHLPNPQKAKCFFTAKGQLYGRHDLPALFRVKGNGLFDGVTTEFHAITFINHLVLSEYKHIFPSSDLTVGAGTANIVAFTQYERKYLYSRQQVVLDGFKIATGKKKKAHFSLAWLPTTTFIKIINGNDKTCCFNFEITGQMDSLKTNLQDRFTRAIKQNLKEKWNPFAGRGKHRDIRKDHRTGRKKSIFTRWFK